MNALEMLRQGPVIPVMTIQDIDTAVGAARALLAGGIRCLEITLRSAGALEAIRLISRALPDALIGAGTIRNARQFDAALNAGARFGVSPGLTREISDWARSTGCPLLPGVATATESMRAADDGFNVQKLFPAEAAGGVALLQALYGPLPDIVFCPTGGINGHNAASYLALPNVECVGGSWLTPQAAMAGKQWDVITRLAQEASALRG